jgi:hypothetical protein
MTPDTKIQIIFFSIPCAMVLITAVLAINGWWTR